MEEKGLRLEQVGESWDELEGNPQAVSVIPHAMIDNAIKYAPAGSTITLTYSQVGTDSLHFKVESFGPEIGDHERERIFEPFFRGEAAKKLSPEGTGFGLAQAQFVAHEMSTGIVVEQDPTASTDGTFRTAFSILLETVPSDERPTQSGAKRNQARRDRRAANA